MPNAPELIHGTVVAHGEDGALIRGPSGAGKSDLALLCLMHALNPMIPGPVRLVTDDYAHVSRAGADLKVCAPKTLAGKLEVRGIGIIDVDTLEHAKLALVVDLVEPAEIARLPDPAAETTILGVRVPVLKLHAFEHSNASKLLLMLARLGPLGAKS